MSDRLTDLRFALIAMAESRRLVLAHHDDVDRVRAALADIGAGTWEVQPSPVAEPGRIIVADMQAVEAETREALQHALFRPPDPPV